MTAAPCSLTSGLLAAAAGARAAVIDSATYRGWNERDFVACGLEKAAGGGADTGRNDTGGHRSGAGRTVDGGSLKGKFHRFDPFGR